MADTFIKIGAMWKGRDKEDRMMLKGSITLGALRDWLDEVGAEDRDDEDRIPVLILSNNYKEEARHPDFNMYGSDPDRPKRGGRGGRGGSSRGSGRGRGKEKDDWDGETEPAEERPRRSGRSSGRSTRKPAPSRSRRSRSSGSKSGRGKAKGRGRLRLNK